MASKLLGPIFWDLERNDDGDRTYTIRFKAKTELRDGPATAFQTPGLPLTGAVWTYGNNFDPWAFCTPYTRVSPTPEIKDEPFRYWIIEKKFSSAPGSPLRRCQDENVEDPLLEPPKISGSFVKYTEEVVQDRFGKSVKNSAHELVRGPQVEFDKNKPNVVIGFNIAKLPLSTFASMVDTVNDRSLWGLTKRKIKLSDVSWERQYYGVCGIFYTVTYRFDIDFKTFDRKIPDEGTKAFGKWNNTTGQWEKPNHSEGPPVVPLDKTNPGHATQYKDKAGENAHVMLNGAGEPLGANQDPVPIPSTSPSGITEYYTESNFLILGIPTVL